jgi:hypothetical protein
MEAFYRMFNRNYLMLQRHAFQTHPNGHSMFSDLDDLIAQKENFIEYIKFEYSIAIFYNIVVSIPSLIYFYLRFNNILTCDVISTIWILIVSIIKLLETVPKGVLIYQTIRIQNNTNDPVICSRRLMYMTRSYIFFYNTVLGYMLLISYTFYFLCIRRSNVCEKATQFYFIINWLVFGFFLRLMISFINYFLHFKYGVNEADVSNADLYVDYQNRVAPEVLNMIEQVTLDDENIDKIVPFLPEEKERDVCCICMLPFQVCETIRLMPCNRKHIFHKSCIDKWLSHNKACPTCRKEINKKLLTKNRIY